MTCAVTKSAAHNCEVTPSRECATTLKCMAMDTRSNAKAPVRHVLFVDDEPKVLEGLRSRLQPLMGKWQMTFVDSGADALSRFEHTPQDVIVSDISMPGMDGAQ